MTVFIRNSIAIVFTVNCLVSLVASFPFVGSYDMRKGARESKRDWSQQSGGFAARNEEL